MKNALDDQTRVSRSGLLQMNNKMDTIISTITGTLRSELAQVFRAELRNFGLMLAGQVPLEDAGASVVQNLQSGASSLPQQNETTKVLLGSSDDVKTIRDVYEEWHHGWDGHKSIKQLIQESKYEWRVKSGAQNKLFSRRSQVVALIEKEVKRGRSVDEVINEFDNERGKTSVSTWLEKRNKKAKLAKEQANAEAN